MNKSFLLLLMSLLFLGSCRPKAESDSQLALSIGPADQFVLPVAIRSCKEVKDGSSDESYGVAAGSVQFNRFIYQWNGSNSLELFYLRLEFNSPDLTGGSYVCYLSDEDFEDTLGASRTISGGDTTEHTAGCAVRCGNIQFNEDVQSSYVLGEATLFGVETTSDGDLIPVTGRASISIQYEKD